MRETTKRIVELVGTPISSEQRARAESLAARARTASSSALTSKFRKTA